MHSLFSSSAPVALALFGALALPAASASETTSTTTASACTATSTTGAYYDLTEDIAMAEGGSKHYSTNPSKDYLVRGWDYGSNFTLNICDPIVNTDMVTDVVGVDESRWGNISAYYKSNEHVYSLGESNGKLTPRGKELVLQYSNGSPCGEYKPRKRKASTAAADDSSRSSHVHPGAKYRLGDDEGDETLETLSESADARYDSDYDEYDDDDDETIRRKSAIVLFTCDRDPTSEGAYVSYIATDADECSYVFKVKSQHACAGAEPHKPGSLGPGSVFAVILGIAVLVYLLGGIFYNRTVNNARGWKQLPNYSLWAGIWSFISDTFIILTSSCARFMPSRRGYSSLSISPNGRGMGRSREDEDRLIGQLDEEWDD